MKNYRGFQGYSPFHSKRFSNIRQLEFITGRKISPIWVGKIHKSIWYFNHQTWMTLHYVITWNVKTYVSHPLKCRMCQNWLKWCSDTPPPPPTPKLQLDFFVGLRKFSHQSLRWWWGVSGTRPPPTTTPKLQLDLLDLENFIINVWGGGGGVSGTYVITWNVVIKVWGGWWGVSGTRPPPTTTPKLQLDFLDLENFIINVWGGGGGGGVCHLCHHMKCMKCEDIH